MKENNTMCHLLFKQHKDPLPFNHKKYFDKRALLPWDWFIRKTSVISAILFAVLSLWIIFTAIPVDAKTSFWKEVFQFAGVSATPAQQRGSVNEMRSGDIWVVDLDSRTSQRVTFDGDYHSPLFDPVEKSILAVQEDMPVRISVSNGEIEKLHPVKGLIKLVGFSKDAKKDKPNKVLILSQDENNAYSVGLLSIKTGQVTAIPHDPKEDQPMLDHIKDWERVYNGKRVYARRRDKGADIYMKVDEGHVVRLSDCGTSFCDQPSLSNDGLHAVFIKTEP
jgi:hypothetical protein